MAESGLLARSREEVGHVARWYADHRGRNERPPSLLLIGGWAVYQYNPYTMSRDIDIIVNSDTRRSLVRWLRSERGFEMQRDELGQQHVRLRTADGNIRLDYASTVARNIFHGRSEMLPFHIARANSVVMDFEEGFLPIPEPGPLLLLKAKALHDRKYDARLPGTDRAWLGEKVAKDESDILSLIDREHGGGELELELVARELQRLPFLFDLIEQIPSHPASCSLYRIARSDAEGLVRTFLSLVR
jgi:hypothetical protein